MSSLREKNPFEMDPALLRRDPVLLLIEPLNEGDDGAELLPSSWGTDSADDMVPRLGGAIGVLSRSLSLSVPSPEEDDMLS